MDSGRETSSGRDTSAVEQRIKHLLAVQLQISTDFLARSDAGTSLLGQGIGLDSIEALTLAVALEDEFEIEVDDADLTAELFATIGTLVDYVEMHVSRTSA